MYFHIRDNTQSVMLASCRTIKIEAKAKSQPVKK